MTIFVSNTSNNKQVEPMKKIIGIILVASLGIASASAMACPKGQHPYGGTGPHHKGGFCGY